MIWPYIFQEGRTCDWEQFLGRRELILELGRTSEPGRRFKTETIGNKIRAKYGVPLPEEDDLSGPICDEMVRETGVELEFVVGYANYEKVVAFWRCNRKKFLERGIRPLTANEKSEKRRKKEEEWKALTERSRDRSRDEVARKAEADKVRGL
jgi:hypothetical protein